MELLFKLRGAGNNLFSAVLEASQYDTLYSSAAIDSCAVISLIEERGLAAEQQLRQLLILLNESRRATGPAVLSSAPDGVSPACATSDECFNQLRTSVHLLTPDLQTAFARLDTVALALRFTLDDIEDAMPNTNDVLTSPEDIIAYAYKLRFTTFQSLGVLPGLPPAPQLDQLHASSLVHMHAENARFVAVAEASKAATTTLPARQPDQPSASTSTQLPPMPSTLPVFDPSQLPVLPPDWQPGDPIHLPVNLPAGFIMPPLPPGWRPGDPVPLPPVLPAAPLVEAGEAQLPAAPQPVGVPMPDMLSFILNADLQEPEAYSSSADDETSEDEF